MLSEEHSFYDMSVNWKKCKFMKFLHCSLWNWLVSRDQCWNSDPESHNPYSATKKKTFAVLWRKRHSSKPFDWSVVLSRHHMKKRVNLKSFHCHLVNLFFFNSDYRQFACYGTRLFISFSFISKIFSCVLISVSYCIYFHCPNKFHHLCLFSALFFWYSFILFYKLKSKLSLISVRHFLYILVEIQLIATSIMSFSLC